MRKPGNLDNGPNSQYLRLIHIHTLPKPHRIDNNVLIPSWIDFSSTKTFLSKVKEYKKPGFEQSIFGHIAGG